MATRESGLWKWLNKVKPIYKTALHLCRIENSAGLGTPDVEGCWQGNQFWIELKCEDAPTKRSPLVKPRFELEQEPWLMRRYKAGGRAFVLLQVGMGAKAHRYLIPAVHIKELQRFGMTESQLIRLSAVHRQATAETIISTAALYERSRGY